MDKDFFIKDNEISLSKINYLENIIALMPGHVYWKDRNCILQGCNDQQAIDAGLKSRKDIVGKSAYDLLFQDQPEKDKQAQAAITNKIDQEVMESGIAKTLEEHVVLPDGKIATFLSRKVPIRNDNGEVVGLVGISFDISDRKQLEDDLRKAKEVAEISEKKVERAHAVVVNFLMILANILRGRLGCIIGAAQVLLGRKPKKDDAPLIEAILSSAQGITPVLERASYYLEIEGGPMGFVKIPLKESMAVPSAVQSLEIKLMNGLQCRFSAFDDITLMTKLVQALNHVSGH